MLLILFHSFALFSGAWPKPKGIEAVPAYGWIARSAYAFMLECFVFISGYLWAFRREVLDREDQLWKIIIEKINRLIIPCFVFGILYILLIERQSSPKESVLLIMEGAGHLWFLPMLFWCFVLGYPIVSKRRNPIKILIILFNTSFLTVLPLPFRISMALYYLFFFIGGYYCLQYKERIIIEIGSKMWLMWLFFAISFIILSLMVDGIENMFFFQNKSMASKLLLREIRSVSSLLYASTGVMALWLSAVKLTSNHHLPKWYIELGKYCMGVYIFQQFILKYLYYQTELPINVGSFWLPWIAFFISLGGSLVLSYTIKQV